MTTKDPLAERLGAALKDHGERVGDVDPGPAARSRVDRRATTLRRRRATGRTVTMLVVAALVVSVAVLPRRGAEDTVSQVANTTTGAPTPHRFVSVPGTPAYGELGEVAAGAHTYPHTSGQGRGQEERITEVTHPILVGATPTGALTYRLHGDRWPVSATIRTTGAPDEPSQTVVVTVVADQGFDPSRLRSTNRRPRTPGDIDAWGTPVTTPTTQFGDLRVVIPPGSCPSDTESTCAQTFVGGTDELVVFVTVQEAIGVDVDELARSLRVVDEAAWRTTLQHEATRDDEPMRAGAFLIELDRPELPPRDEAAWPAEVPADFCTAFKQWKQIQIESLPAFGAQGWVRWTDRLAELAPPELAPHFASAAEEARQGGDPSSDMRASGLAPAVEGADRRCPF